VASRSASPTLLLLCGALAARPNCDFH
jgi:hypothetical protein